MKKLATVMATVFLTAASSAALAGPDDGTLRLFQKCDDTGCPSGSGPWPAFLPADKKDKVRTGELKYKLWGPLFSFDFKGEQLTPAESYTLIYYRNPWGAPVTCLGQGVADKKGNVKIKDALDTGSLPSANDANYLGDNPGAKIWLVPSNDVDCVSSVMTAWNPAEYLFEYNSIVYTQTP
jgi:hypothetical protein